jgi:hypothetical protein
MMRDTFRACRTIERDYLFPSRKTLKAGLNIALMPVHMRQRGRQRGRVVKGVGTLILAYPPKSSPSSLNATSLFLPPQNVIEEFPQFPVTTTYKNLQEAFIDARTTIA